MISSLDDEQAFREQASKDGVDRLVARVSIFHDGELLVLRRAPGTSYEGQYELPGGSVEDGETFTNAAARETLEETGLQVTGTVSEFKSFDYKNQIDLHIRQVNYYVTVAPGEIKLNPSEHDDYRWIRQADIDSLNIDRGTSDCLHSTFAA
jgi:8-oxo-dGTP diphosphatase